MNRKLTFIDHIICFDMKSNITFIYLQAMKYGLSKFISKIMKKMIFLVHFDANVIIFRSWLGIDRYGFRATSKNKRAINERDREGDRERDRG
jgi:hypothetical protein